MRLIQLAVIMTVGLFPYCANALTSTGDLTGGTMTPGSGIIDTPSKPSCLPMSVCMFGAKTTCSSACTDSTCKGTTNSAANSNHIITRTTKNIKYTSFYDPCQGQAVPPSDPNSCNCTQDCTCETTTSYACAAGYYGSPTSTSSGCTKCPSGPNGETTTSAVNNNSTIAKCYIPSGTTGSDGTGSFKYSPACYQSDW